MMDSAQFISALKTADFMDLSYSVKEFNITESEFNSSESTKNVSCSFVASFTFGNAQITLRQGLSIDYYSTDGQSYQRKELERVDYVDDIVLVGFRDIENGQFDLVFLLSQLEQQGAKDADLTYYKVKQLIDLMFKKASVDNTEIYKMLINAFDSRVLAMSDVNKLMTKESKERLIEALTSLKMSEIEPQLSEANYHVDNLSYEKSTELHQYISGDVTCRFHYQDIQFTVQYYLLRKYPAHEHGENKLCLNDTHFDPYRIIRFSNKSGELDIDLNGKEASLALLDNNSSLFYKLQSLFALIKRKNNLACITDVFDKFYDNWLKRG